jgi:hypothetical protein
MNRQLALSTIISVIFISSYAQADSCDDAAAACAAAGGGMNEQGGYCRTPLDGTWMWYSYCTAGRDNHRVTDQNGREIGCAGELPPPNIHNCGNNDAMQNYNGTNYQSFNWSVPVGF